MDDTPLETTSPGATSRPASTGEESTSFGGCEINLGDFTRSQGLIKSLRLTLNGQVVIAVEELASGISDAGRKFKLGDIEQANLDVARLYASFGQRTNQWENQARNLEQQMKMEAAKNPKSISIDKMNRMKSEQTAVRTRIRTAEVQFRRLHQGLDLAFTNRERQGASARSLSSALAPPGFLTSFQSASLAARSDIVKQHFEIEAVITVAVSRSAISGYEIRFDPKPPLDRVYYLTERAQLVVLQQLGSAVLLQDLETGQKKELRLVEFVKQVQAGAWLLKPRA